MTECIVAGLEFLSTLKRLWLSWRRNFYPRSPCGERRLIRHYFHPSEPNFYPRSPCGERPIGRRGRAARGNFYPRPPCGERQCCRRVLPRFHRFLSTLSLRRATERWSHSWNHTPISIHALLAESDRSARSCTVPRCRFLSTLSLRRAT